MEPEHVILALTTLKDFLVERGIKQFLIPVYDPNRCRLNPRELYAILHMVFAETKLTAHLHKKYYLRLA